MGETIAILGANGVYARHLIPKLIAAGHAVRAVVRRPEAAGVARASGAVIATGDIFDVASMTAAFQGCAIALNLATSLPGPSGRGDFAANDKLRVEGVPNFVAACRNAGVAKIMQQSIGWVAASGNADWSDEDAVYRALAESISTRAIAAALTMEQTIRSSDLDWLILRGGLFYGPGTGFDDGWYGRAAAGKLRLPGDGTDYVSLVHIADMASATAAAIGKWPSRAVLTI
jgi:nucleoside-diphosphate-sugar epimerase